MSLLLMSIIYASPCSDYQMDKASYYAKKAANQIVNDKYDGGNDIYSVVSKCSYNNFSNEFSLKIEIHWNGAVFESNQYECDGVLNFDDNGKNPQFSVTYQNDELQLYLSRRNMFAVGVGTLIYLDSLNNQN
jgi:hypothetical protein